MRFPGDNREPVKPTHDVPIKIAQLDLSRADHMAIKTAWGAALKDIKPSDDIPYALVWALERKAGRHLSVDEISEWSGREVLGYFPEDEEEQSRMEAEMGKAFSGVETTPES